MPGWAVQIIIAVVMAVLAYALSPKPKGPQTPKAQDLQSPTVDAGRAIPVVFGRVRVKSPNLLWMGGQRSKAIRK